MTLIHTNYKSRITILPTGPGPQQLAYYDAVKNTGYYGLVPSNDFIAGDVLATDIGLTVGTAINVDTPWLKFTIANKVVFIPQKPIRHSASWQAIYQAGAVYGTDTNGLFPSGGNRLQDARVTIGGNQFRVRLIKAVNSDPSLNAHNNAWDHVSTHGSEWNRLMYHVHNGVHPSHASNTMASEGISVGDWAQFSEATLVVGNSGAGSLSICQERAPASTDRMLRGFFGISYSYWDPVTTANSSRGWRPALELI